MWSVLLILAVHVWGLQAASSKDVYYFSERLGSTQATEENAFYHVSKFGYDRQEVGVVREPTGNVTGYVFSDCRQMPAQSEFASSLELQVLYKSAPNADPAAIKFSLKECLENDLVINGVGQKLLGCQFYLVLNGLQFQGQKIQCGRPFRNMLGNDFLKKLCEMCAHRGKGDDALFTSNNVFSAGKVHQLRVVMKGSKEPLVDGEISVTASGTGYSVRYRLIDGEVGEEDRCLSSDNLLYEHFMQDPVMRPKIKIKQITEREPV